MRYFCNIIVFALLIGIGNVKGQNLIPIESYIDEIPILNIEDSILINLIDHHMHNVQICSMKDSYRAQYVFLLSINYNTMDNEYIIYTMFCSPSGLDRIPNIGMLQYNSSTYVIFGDAAELFFRKSDKKDSISYFKYYAQKGVADESGCIILCELSWTEDLCERIFTYKDGKLNLPYKSTPSSGNSTHPRPAAHKSK